MQEDNNLKIGLMLAATMGIFLVGYYLFSFKDNEKNEEENQPVQVEYGLEWRGVASSSAWAPRDSHASFVFQNKIWIIGGLNGNNLLTTSGQIEYWKAPHFNDIWNSDDGMNWTKIETRNIWPGRRSMSIAEFHGSLWMFGGWSPATGYSSDLWKSEDGINWTKAEVKLPWEAREGQIAEIFDGKLLVMGGVNYDRRKTFNDVWYTEDGTNWLLATSSAPWSSRWDFALGELDGNLYLMGGMNIVDDEFNDVWMLDDEWSWSRVTDSAPWATRQGHGAAYMGDRLWIFGRLNDKEHPGPNDMWSTLDGMNWENEGELPWDGREDFTTVIFKGKLYLMGGMGRDWTWRNDVWEAELNELEF